LILYFAKRGYEDKIRQYIDCWGGSLADRIRVVHYDDEAEAEELPEAACIFATLDRLGAEDTARAEGLWDALAARLGTDRLLNHPRRTLRRRALLRELADRGINRFRAHEVSGAASARYPVFLREATRHTGSLSPLLYTPEEVRRAIADARGNGHEPDALLLVEFLDTADGEGLYRKYSAFVVADRIVPRQVQFSRDWVTKLDDVVTPDTVAEMGAYLEGNPHQDRLRELARLAAVGYGRFDYAVLPDGDLQVWEINTNPVIVSGPDHYPPGHQAVHLRFAEAIGAALAALADP
jgi:hypothetical protein